MNLTADSTSGVETSDTSIVTAATVTVIFSPTSIASSNGSTTAIGSAVGAVLGTAFLSVMAGAVIERHKRQRLARQFNDATLRISAAGEVAHQHKHGQVAEMTGLHNRRYKLLNAGHSTVSGPQLDI